MEPLDCWHCWGFELRSNHSCDQALGSDYDLGAISGRRGEHRPGVSRAFQLSEPEKLLGLSFLGDKMGIMTSALQSPCELVHVAEHGGSSHVFSFPNTDVGVRKTQP